MPQKLIDLTGIRFGFLTVLEYQGTRAKHAIWSCACDCGQVVQVSGSNLRSKNTRSCGCKAGELKASKHKLRKAKNPPPALPPNQKSQAQIKREQKEIRKLHELRKARKGT